MGAVESLICWENLDSLRVQLRNPHTDVEQAHYLKDPKLYRDPDSNVELEIVNNELFVEWIAVNYKTFGTKLDLSPTSLMRGISIVGLLRCD